MHFCRFIRLISSPHICHSSTFASSSKVGTNGSPINHVNAFSLRTHNCGELRLTDVGKRVKLYGWLAHSRMKNRFLVLRDAYGVIQTFVPTKLAASLIELHLESCLCVEGIVQDRGKDRSKNKQMVTGDIEIYAETIDVLNYAKENLPLFDTSNQITRQTHRYLDIRSKEMQNALRLRAKIISQIRRYLDDHCGFVEVQTPSLSHFTPGGAAEFLVPANSSGECYSLPQSPQIYKQLLMCGSMDRYYQVAICYRDETVNPFRQPEFTQLDLEMSFTDQDSIISLVEQIIVEAWPVELSPKPSIPFQRMAYTEAMTKYGSDKPDLRIPWEIFELPIEVKGQKARAFVAPGITGKHLRDEQLAEWKEKISHFPYKQEYTILNGKLAFQDQQHLIKLDNLFLTQHNVDMHNDAIVICWGDDQQNVLKVLGHLRNFLAGAIGLRQSQHFNFLWVHKFPLFTWNENSGMLQSSHHPFTAPIPEHLEQLMEGRDMESIEAQHYDLVLNGVEVGGGSIRIHNAILQKHVLEDLLHLDSTHLQHLLDALSYGAPPHGGFALGLDRYVTILNAKGDPNASIRSVIAFPKASQGQCLMTGSPAVPNEKILNRYGLNRIRKEEEDEMIEKNG